MSRPLFRVDPVLPAAAMQTYGIRAPVSTHYRTATCMEVDCKNLEYGWRTTIDESTDLGKAQGYYIRNQSGRKFAEVREGALTIFTFECGQKCFEQHKVPLGRPGIYLLRGGDWRGDPRGEGIRRFDRPDQWVEHFAGHQDRLQTQIERRG